ncbi:hypothetical protein TVAG_248380 [Trichomonas vaginalis G3]|uniref:Uncharacterized protein n=1 Tax=Trichomonas vaginalis (strain ATCC PRA-98 / G3) TaxID=412133 RepID=A2E774_TRIV3|nr:ankyrin repeat domain-containing protein 49 family [Trichomonas vaginalis G3]EAY11471.1 hypothetical protein TVAG_248380 [Trichomonas vaginalis G3]KAI5526766.1 ankyrin repeat domain-containing protein 49 family [Trichomonas vaginalis G3]|eukprot:XP_001323694.1 hypothetical protein [Trichomonas vaginalis G3]
MYKVNPEVFSQQSTKFAEEYQQNPQQLKFEENVAKETFEAFINSCQLRPYVISDLLIFELLDLYRKWGCNSLEAHCYSECKNRGLRPRPREDYIGILLDKIDNNEETVEDLRHVAEILNDSWDDDRLPDIEPELLYRIVVLAEKYNMDMDELTKFTMNLYDINPESAVLLTLRLDFDHLSEEQIDRIFHCSEMHNISIGFFVAMSISAVRNRTKDNLVDSECNHIKMMNEFQREMDYDRRHMIMRLDQEHEDEMRKLMDTLVKQHRKLEELTDYLTDTAERLDSGPLSPRGIGDPKLKALKEETDEKLQRIYNRIQADVEQNLAENSQVFENSIAKIEAEWEADCADPRKVSADTDRAIAIAGDKAEELSRKLDEIEAQVKRSKASIAAKIVRDQTRGISGMVKDAGKDNHDSKYSIFKGESSLWGLTEEDVKKEVKTIKDLETLIDQLCPIRGAATRGPKKN